MKDIMGMMKAASEMKGKMEAMQAERNANAKLVPKAAPDERADHPTNRAAAQPLRVLHVEDSVPDHELALLHLLRAGAGIGVCQTALARRDPNLVRVLPTRLSMKLTTWVAMHEGLRNSPRCKAAFDALVKGLRRYVK